MQTCGNISCRWKTSKSPVLPIQKLEKTIKQVPHFVKLNEVSFSSRFGFLNWDLCQNHKTIFHDTSDFPLVRDYERLDNKKKIKSHFLLFINVNWLPAG